MYHEQVQVLRLPADPQNVLPLCTKIDLLHRYQKANLFRIMEMHVQ